MEPLAPEKLYATVDIKDDPEALARGGFGQDPNNYVCNGGPLSTPGGRLYDRMVGTERPVEPV